MNDIGPAIQDLKSARFQHRLGYHPREEEMQGGNLISGLFDPAGPNSNFFSPAKRYGASQSWCRQQINAAVVLTHAEADPPDRSRLGVLRPGAA